MKTTSSKPVTSKKPSDESESKLAEFFKDELKDIYWAENHLVKSLPKMEKAATSDQLKKAFADHLQQTKVHVTRLDKIFSLLGKKAVAKKCEALAGILEEANGIIEDTEKGTATRDAGLIIGAQKVEHYEISTYGGLSKVAETLGYREVAQILSSTLVEEKAADHLLTTIAEGSVNVDASGEIE